ncbi:hypothetical protein BABINDRAFT_159585 [Babjeviella inositovora NRRL Y-12698]|uniref:Uncharacterized protein n=1 Tax=Babjeviella inositovora NRRL Y-12698 TaxID=984486 RepID=A0A1E3QZN1_9ASCO|nr:uncharacterized protein BABINDRAFT_159585 [Babjeviella inositovora NRRL Y-12698]ODQ83133.1 hypothetical protein BABINDRAFT_159585 [Babjeviella inositovora NRRL Y-12698]
MDSVMAATAAAAASAINAAKQMSHSHISDLQADVLDPQLNLNHELQTSSYDQMHMHMHDELLQDVLESNSNLDLQGNNHHEIVHEHAPAALDVPFLAQECTRCKKDFNQPVGRGRTFKLCPHCRDLQRQRSKRWQQRTKEKPGACRRCGAMIPPTEENFVLCAPCRLNLRSRKALRAANGKCVHCSGPNDSINEDFKVCSRCRTNDKIRRTNLEKQGACNRCTARLSDDDLASHKVCYRCRNRKKKVPSPGPGYVQTHIHGQMSLQVHLQRQLQQHQLQQSEADAAAAILNSALQQQAQQLIASAHLLPQQMQSYLLSEQYLLNDDPRDDKVRQMIQEHLRVHEEDAKVDYAKKYQTEGSNLFLNPEGEQQ